MFQGTHRERKGGHCTGCTPLLSALLHLSFVPLHGLSPQPDARSASPFLLLSAETWLRVPFSKKPSVIPQATTTPGTVLRAFRVRTAFSQQLSEVENTAVILSDR